MPHPFSLPGFSSPSCPPSFPSPPALEQGVMRVELNWSPPSGKQQEKIVHSERQEGVPPGLPYGRMTSLACCPIPTVHNRVTVAFSTVAQQPRGGRETEKAKQRERDRERKGKSRRMPAMLRPKGLRFYTLEHKHTNVFRQPRWPALHIPVNRLGQLKTSSSVWMDAMAVIWELW